jgi:very-short-patch-repair endonuclease
MKTLRTRLNEFTDALHRTRGPLGISVYEATGRAADATQELTAHAVSPLAFPVRGIKDVTNDQLYEMEAMARKLAGNPALTESEGETVWTGAFNDPTRPNLKNATENVLRLLEGQMKRIEHAAVSLAPLCGLDVPNRLTDTALLLDTAEALLDSASAVHPIWLTGAEDPETLRGMAEELVGRYAIFREQRDALLRRWEEEILGENHSALIDRLDARHSKTLTPLLGEDWRDRVASEFEHIVAVLDAVAQDGRILTERLTYLSDKSGLVLDGSLDARQKLLKISRQAIDLPNPCVGWFAPGATDRLVGVLQESKSQWDKFRKGTDLLYTHYSEDILDLNHNELMSTLEGQRGGFGRIISLVNNKVASALRAVTRPGANTKDRDPEEDLRLAAEMKQIRVWSVQNLERFTNSFGSYYVGGDTNWDGIRLQLEKASTLCAEFEDGRVPAPLIALMLLGDSDLKQFESVFQQVNDLLAHLRGAWDKLTAVAVAADALPDPTMSLPELTLWCDEHKKAVIDFHEAYRLTLQYRRDDKDAAALPLPITEVLSDLAEAQRIAKARVEFDGEYESLGARYGAAYNGKDTDWAGVFAGLSTASRLRASFENRPIPASLTERLNRPLIESEKDEIRMVRQMLRDEDGMMTSVFAELNDIFKPEYLTITEGETVTPLPSATFLRITGWATTRLAEIGNLSAGMRLQTLRDQCASLRLEGFFDAASGSAATLSGETMLHLFRVGFYRLWAESALAEDSGILPFSGASHEAKIERFRDLDRHQMDAVPGLIRELVRVRSPKNYPDEVKTLKGQLARRRTGEVRRLLAEIPNLLFALKPIVMMNPLSVRLFLDANALHFDVVLFDDASQISTEDAIGAILRGNQVIIAGDPKQIPPLALLVESEKPFESILDAANAVASKDSPHFGSHVLRWHYRSRNESLIAFSRRYFYPELVSFPSATVDSAIEYVETTADESGVDANGPEKVVDAVLAYAKEHPEHSIGVVALDDPDYERITEEIARRKEADPELSFPGEHDENGEGFFLKTLENVQGDERDMVVLYVGSDPSRCKPLSAFGGERLLNVAITRARCRMIIVSAFRHDAPTPDDVVEHQGMLLLRSFLRYAKEGVDKAEIGASDDPAASLLLPGTHMPAVPMPSIVENVVEKVLQDKGHQLRRQVGLSEYRVDIAVVDPEKPGRYLLGIEFDGPMYATGETARHRDRLRIDMLLDRGWNLHRVWALDFEADPAREIARIEAAIANAKKHGIPGVRTKSRRVGKKEAEIVAVAE